MAPPTDAPQGSADPFHGKRSLATARLYLLDLVERLFARPDPGFAQHMHEQLRQASDQDAVMATAQELLRRVEAVAGTARAEGIRQRLDRLWPVSTVDIEMA